MILTRVGIVGQAFRTPSAHPIEECGARGAPLLPLFLNPVLKATGDIFC
jgi:hypothetical protein